MVVDEYGVVALPGRPHEVSPQCCQVLLECVAVLLELGKRAVEDVRRIDQAGARAKGAKHGNQRVRDRDPRKGLPPVRVPERDGDQHGERNERHHGEHHGGKAEKEHADQPLLFLSEFYADQFQACFENGEHGADNAAQRPLRIVLRVPVCRHGLSARSALFLARRFPAGSCSRPRPVYYSERRSAKPRRSQAVAVFTGRIPGWLTE